MNTTATFKDIHDGEVITRKVRNYTGYETITLGNYSMAPGISSEDKVKTEEKKEEETTVNEPVSQHEINLSEVIEAVKQMLEIKRKLVNRGLSSNERRAMIDAFISNIDASIEWGVRQWEMRNYGG